MKTIYTVFLLLLLLSCTSSSEKLAWEIANNSQTNKKELTRFLEHYKTNKDKDKYKAACFLIENMPNKYSINGKEQKIYDIDIVSSKKINLQMTFTTPLCPMGEQIKQDVKESMHLLKFEEVNITITFEPPWKPSDELRKALGV